MGLLYQDLSDKIIGCFYRVYNEQGFGFYKQIYVNSLRVDLTECGLVAVPELPATVYYHGHNVGTYLASLCVEGKIILVIEAEEHVNHTHEAKLLNYLKATEFEVGFVLNFGLKPAFVRKIFENKHKKSLPVSRHDESSDNADGIPND
ncbi:MAG: GxxExxY protein [Candidatus Sumerlaeia bacterium]